MKKHLIKITRKIITNPIRKIDQLGVFMLLLLALTFAPTVLVYGQFNKKGPLKNTGENAGSPIKWMSMEEAYNASKVVNKPLFIDVYTSWCGWCKRMDQTTFKDPVVAGYINSFFHPVKFNAETNDTINFLEKTYWNSQTAYVKRLLAESDSVIQVLNDSIKLLGSGEKNKVLVNALSQRLQQTTANKSKMARQGRRTTHDLAREVMNGKMSYPTFVLLFDSLKNNYPIKGYQKPNQLLSLLSFFAENVYRNTKDLGTYQNLFLSSLSANNGQLRKVEGFNKTIKKASLSKKKTVFYIASDQLYTSQVFEKGCMNDPAVLAYLAEKFEVGKLDLYEKDSLTFDGKVFKNVNGMHQLPVLLMQNQNNQVEFPTMVFLDENQKLIMSIPGFFLPSDLLSILHFIEEEAYKFGDYGTFRKKYEKRKAAKAGQ